MKAFSMALSALLLQLVIFSFASPNSFSQALTHGNLYSCLLKSFGTRDATHLLNALQAWTDCASGPDRLRNNEICSDRSSDCEVCSAHSGTDYTGSCDAVAECGRYSQDGQMTCPLNACCSLSGFSDTTSAFCNTGCPTSCSFMPERPAGSTNSDTLSMFMVFYKAWTLNSQMTRDDLSSWLRKDCYVQSDSLTSCKLDDDQVGYDKAGRVKDYKPICCPKGSGMTQCQWRSGSGGTNAGRDCNGQCHAGEVKITSSDHGGSPGESSETARCTRGKKAFCCSMGMFDSILSQCSWSRGVESTCKSDQQKLAYVWDETGWNTTLKHGNEFCCPKADPPPLLDCRWVGKGDCADNTCEGSEVTLMTDERGDKYSACGWGRKRSLCCTPNTSTIQSALCDIDLSLLPDDQAAYEDKEDYDDQDGHTASLGRLYFDSEGAMMWSYEAEGFVRNVDHDLEATIAPPGAPRQFILRMGKLAGTIYQGKDLIITDRRYWPGQLSLRRDGAETLPLRGGFDLLKEVCAATVMRYVPASQFTPTGWEAEHIREFNMIAKFLTSLLTGKLFSGAEMRHKFDPMAIYTGWNKLYDVSLPRIGALVRDAPLFKNPITPNDRIMETLGSYAYRGGMSFLPGDLNKIKSVGMRGRTLLNSPPNSFDVLLKSVADSGSEVAMKIVLWKMQGTIEGFNYLNDAQLHRAFIAAGEVLTLEMARADRYMPELKGILDAWKEWEVDYYAHVAFRASEWLLRRSGDIAERFSGGVGSNLNALKLLSQAAMLRSQVDRIKSPLAS